MPDSLLSLDPPSLAHQRRLTWAMRGMGEPLIAALQRDRSPEADQLRKAEVGIPAESVARLIMDQADPTSNKRFTAWLVREYAEGRLILEDLGTANETLTLFQCYAPRLKPEQRDIQRYGSLAAAWEVVRGFAERDEVHSNKAQRALDRAKAYEESRILRQDPDGFTIAVPLTEFAAKWWGKGTRWCTAAEKNNQFSRYNNTGPLLVIITAQGAKFQLWKHIWNDENFEFRAADDSEASFLPMAAFGDAPLYGLFQALLLLSKGKALRSIPLAYLGHYRDLCHLAVDLSPKNLALVPHYLRTKPLCEFAFERDAMVLHLFPDELLTPELEKIALERDPRWVIYMKPDEITEDHVLDCLRKDGLLLGLHPISLFRKPSFFLTAVRQNGRALIYVPQNMITADVIRCALESDGSALEFVQDQQKTDSLCELAVRSNGLALKHVPKELRTQELCMIAVENDGAALQYVPTKLRSVDICMTARKTCNHVHIWFPDSISAQFCHEFFATADTTPKEESKGGIQAEIDFLLETFEAALTREISTGAICHGR